MPAAPDAPISVYMSTHFIGDLAPNRFERLQFRLFGIPEHLHEKTYQVTDNYSKVFGAHSLKFGGIHALSQANMATAYGSNGIFSFNGIAETGLDFADFLLGAHSQWTQGLQWPLYNSGRYYGLFAQDSWRDRRDLTLNYGLR